MSHLHVDLCTDSCTCLQPPTAENCGKPAPDAPVRYTLVKQWPFDMCGTSTLTSAAVLTPRPWSIDLVPYFKRLSDLLAHREGKTDVSDFWTDADMHLKMPYVHHPTFKNVKKALSDQWQTMTDTPFPPYDGYVTHCASLCQLGFLVLTSI
jgi:hypothetical protein